MPFFFVQAREALQRRERRKQAKLSKLSLLDQRVNELVSKTQEKDEWWPEEDALQLEEDDLEPSTLKKHCADRVLSDNELEKSPCASTALSPNMEPSEVADSSHIIAQFSAASKENEYDDNNCSSVDGLPTDEESSESDLVDSFEGYDSASSQPVLTNEPPATEGDDDSLLLDPSKEHPDNKLREELAVWAVKYHIRSRALSDLLQTLRNHGHSLLPKSSKTLLSTPRSTVKDMRDLAGGKFYYFGILKSMQNRMSSSYLNGIRDGKIIIDVFTDGLAPYRSTGAQIWPIVGRLKDQKVPFLIAIWCGELKEPKDLDAFWEDYINEAQVLMEGFELHGKSYKLEVRRYMADAPARAWIKQVNPHNSKICCQR